MTYLGIDHGTKRIGLALADAESRVATPIKNVSGTGGYEAQVRAVLAVAEVYGADQFVVGLPLHMDDSESGQSKLVRKFGELLRARSGKLVHYFDERLSSFSADELLAPAELTHKKHKALQDAVAAQWMLQGFVDSL